ncbi:MAG: FKBP-type peptidyl-prolyl cis-trans isomerase [Fuerstiella sp.]
MKSQLIIITTVAALFAATGCTSPLSRKSAALADVNDPGQSDAFQTVSSSSDAPVTFLDSSAVQSGTGPMDESYSSQFQITASGLRYRVLRKGSGRQPTASDSVTVHYRGWLDSGKEFDSSYSRGETTSFPLNGVIAGWTEGMQLVGQGGMIELWVPARLGYGKTGNGNVPPNATLHFIVELVSIN